MHENGSYVDCTGGAAALIDRNLLGINHVYQSPTCKHIYDGPFPHDPEGLLGCLTSIVLAYLGKFIILNHNQIPCNLYE